MHRESQRSFSLSLEWKVTFGIQARARFARERLTRFLSEGGKLVAMRTSPAVVNLRPVLRMRLLSDGEIRGKSRSWQAEECARDGESTYIWTDGRTDGRVEKFPSRSRLPRSGLNTPESLTLIEYSAIALHHPRRNSPKKRDKCFRVSPSFLRVVRKRTDSARFLSENRQQFRCDARDISTRTPEIKRNIVIRSRHIMYMSSREGARVG